MQIIFAEFNGEPVAARVAKASNAEQIKAELKSAYPNSKIRAMWVTARHKEKANENA